MLDTGLDKVPIGAMKTTPTALDADPQLGEAEFHRRVVRELVDTGMALIRAIHQAAKAHANGSAGANAVALSDLAASYELVAGSIRRSVVLAQRLGVPAEQPSEGEAADHVTPQASTLLN